jgi:ubiquinone/menaquinone biosynthesis C-methylase UbiE
MKKLLHIGCGASRIGQTTSGFNNGSWSEIRIDINALNQPDIIGSMTDMSVVTSDSMDAIFSSHNIEHLYPHEVPLAIDEFHRVLSSQGFCVITCPDIQAVCALIAQDKLLDPAYMSPAGPIAPIDILFGHRQSLAQGNLFMAHRTGFTEKTLSTLLKNTGFKAVRTMRRPQYFDLWAIASKLSVSEAQIEELANAHFPKT